MKKTLLIAGAALAASVITSQAQVYSQNIVGYVNITIPNNTFQMVANQMDTGSNYVDNVFTSGAVSSDTTLLIFTNGLFHQYIYYNSNDSLDGGVGWYDLLSNVPATNLLFAPSGGGLVHNTSGGPITLTTVGTVLQGTNLVNIPTGFSIHSIPVPLGGTPPDAVGFPGTSSQDYYLRFNGSTYHQYIFYNSNDSLDGNTGWYDLLSNVAEDTNAAAWANAGEGFFLNHQAPPITWTNVFIAQ
jgi:hypothetical protein